VRTLRSYLLLSTAVILAAASLWAGPAHAQDATWSATPGSGDFNTGANWVSVPPNTVPTGTAFFDASTITNLTFSANTTIGGWTFNAGAADYVFTNTQALLFDGAGIVINSGTATIDNDNLLEFLNNSSAGGATINNRDLVTQFLGGSSAGSAVITNDPGGLVSFSQVSTADGATIINNGALRFSDTSTAGTAAADITNNAGALMQFFDSSRAGSARVTDNRGELNFRGSSSADSADITNNAGGRIQFFDTSSAGGATAIINNNATLSFNDSSNAGSGAINNGGTLQFFATSRAGTADIINNAGGLTRFFDDSSADGATITVNGLSTLRFDNRSTASSADITNHFFTQFFGSSTAGGATITNNFTTTFFGSSNAGTAGITNNNGALLQFLDNSSAENAEITNNGGAEVNFLGSATGGNATIINESGGLVEFDFTSTAGSAAAIIRNNGGSVAFIGNSRAGSATINNNNAVTGGLQFTGSSSADNATINNSNFATFDGSSTADSAEIINSNLGTVRFIGSSTAGGSEIENNGIVSFSNFARAGTATIDNFNLLELALNSTAFAATINNFNVTDFTGNSTAGNARINNDDTVNFTTSSRAGTSTITNSGGADLFFRGTSSADGATINNNSGARTIFLNTSTGGQAQIVTNAGGRTDFSGSTGPLNNNQLTAGSLAGSGAYFLGANALTVGGNGLSSEVSGVISDCGPTGNDCVDAGATGGSLVKTGGGVFTLSGANIYTGPTTVNDGSLIVNGSITSGVTVNGGVLGGTGQTGELTVNAGGTVAPGNSIGTMTVNGAFTLGAGAVYEVEANAAGQSDKVIVNGTVNLTGATLRVLAEGGDYQLETDYVIIENDGTDGVQGRFARVSTNLVFLIPMVLYDAGDGNDVVLVLERNDTHFQDVAKTKNQRAVAGALDKFATDNPFVVSLHTLSPQGARQAFDALSGEIHATVAGTLSDDSRYVREAVLGRLMQASHINGGAPQMAALAAGGPQVTSSQVASLDSQAYALGYDGKSLVEPSREPLAFWTQGYGAWGDFDSDGNAAAADRDLGGFISGMDADIGSGWRAGLATGASFSNVSVDARYSSADVSTYHLGGYVGGMAGAFALRGGGLWAWSSIDTSRAVVFPNFYERQKASYDADTGQLFGEIAYPTQMGGIALEPFGGLAFVSVDTDSFTERGGPQASLRGRNLDQDVGYTSLGLRAATTMHWGQMLVTPNISVAWLHAFDDVTPGASLAFATTGIGFAIDGVPLAEDSALLDAGLDFALSDRVSAGVSYTGQYGDGVTDNGVKGRFTWLF